MTRIRFGTMIAKAHLSIKGTMTLVAGNSVTCTWISTPMFEVVGTIVLKACCTMIGIVGTSMMSLVVVGSKTIRTYVTGSKEAW